MADAQPIVIALASVLLLSAAAYPYVDRLLYPRRNIEQCRFLITGACGGLGSATCWLLANKGAATLVLWDVRDDTLKELATALCERYPNLQVIVRKVNLLYADQIIAAAEDAVSKTPIDCVINIAGIAFCSERVGQISYAQEEAMIKVNYLAPITIAKFFVDYFEKQGGGHIVCVASMASFISGSGLTSYAASKFAMRGFLEGLAGELFMQRSKVALSGFFPPPFDSKLFEGIDERIFKQWSCQDVARLLTEYSIQRRAVVAMFPKYMGVGAVVSLVVNLFGYFLIVPVNVVAQWRAGEYARQSLGNT